MPTIYCSQKLSKLLNLKKEKTDNSSLKSDVLDWNASLFYLSKRKCLLFMNKSSLYSVAILDILKKDLDDISTFFIENLIRQLKTDNLLTEKYESFIAKSYKIITLKTTDNDKRIIGSINDCVYRIGIYEEIIGGVQNLSADALGFRLNFTPLGALKYKFPVDIMKKSIKNHT